MKAFFSVFVLLALLMLPQVTAQPSALYEVSLDQRIGSAAVVVEGRVSDQSSFWNAEGTRIYTANTVDVYRVFRGSAEITSIDVITPGGVVGLKAQLASHSLGLRSGDVGVFFLSPSRSTAGLSKWASATTFDVYASEQGFIRYDEFSGAASDVFNVYRDIDSEVREVLAEKLGPPSVLVDYAAPRRPAPKGSLVPVITSFSPNPITAGTATVLTINGTGFEAQGANSKVFFPNADDGGGTLIEAPDSEEISWTDTQIQVRVPTRAGTGSFVVQTHGGAQGTSATALAVDYNLINIAFQGFKRSILQDKVNGGYSLVMSTNVSSQGVDFATSNGVDPFDRALTTWQTSTGLNMRNDGGFTTENTVDPNTDPDIIMFDNDGNPLPSGVLGRAFSGFSSTNGEDWYVDGVDIQFRRNGTNNITWNFGPGSTQFCCFDFESVALHEIGHAHQLGHIIESGAVMHFNISNGNDVRTLNATSDIAGGDEVIAFSSSKPGGMSPLVGVGIDDEPIARSHGLQVTAAFPNPTSDHAVFAVQVDRSQGVRVDVYDVLGRRVMRLYDGVMPPGVSQKFGIGTEDLPSGLYYYSVTGEEASLTRAVILQR